MKPTCKVIIFFRNTFIKFALIKTKEIRNFSCSEGLKNHLFHQANFNILPHFQLSIGLQSFQVLRNCKKIYLGISTNLKFNQAIAISLTWNLKYILKQNQQTFRTDSPKYRTCGWLQPQLCSVCSPNGVVCAQFRKKRDKDEPTRRTGKQVEHHKGKAWRNVR